MRTYNNDAITISAISKAVIAHAEPKVAHHSATNSLAILTGGKKNAGEGKIGDRGHLKAIAAHPWYPRSQALILLARRANCSSRGDR